MDEYISLKKSNCKDCYKCIRHCPVQSIKFSGHQAHIIKDECILCGRCFVVCPQNAKVIRNDLERARVLLGSSDTVVASIAPAFAANYPGATIGTMEEALKQLGFDAVEETAIGATMVTRQYEKMLNSGASTVISSCCHTLNLMIQKYYPEALPYLAKSVTPMQAHCMDIKKRYEGAKTIFIGPCVSKKAEADLYPGNVDVVLTFEELTQWLKEEGVKIKCGTDHNNQSRARLYPTMGGIVRTMKKDRDKYSYFAVDGLEKCKEVIKDVIAGKMTGCFIEMSACTGSCIAGPAMDKEDVAPVTDYLVIDRYAGREDFPVSPMSDEEMKREHQFLSPMRRMPSEEEIKDILKRMGKTKPEDELNCGTCGYDTCREKAIAVYQGKAEITMCLPFLKNKAESFSDNIIKNTPNGIIVLNGNFEVQQINKSAINMMNIRSASDVLGDQIVRILDPEDFMQVKNKSANIYDKRVYLAEYDKYVEETILLDKSYNILICIMRDITDEERVRETKEKISKQTIEITDKVVDNQMRVVQEIASLLGETAAETKIALTKLKESLTDE